MNGRDCVLGMVLTAENRRSWGEKKVRRHGSGRLIMREEWFWLHMSS